ncbi:MAG TPA: SHOCT domain-containing protein [Nocardioides sp.]|uniref:SHOCT domain-containing protein n=1 Tax=Nocardioides sp. TaxID=35761 RepID=UPI002D80120D|nr:SHOCT domain-containing protein [Nocardioides sp.]HET6651284.1 SHOCT domain-containing protein [Nocardioides sp.]
MFDDNGSFLLAMFEFFIFLAWFMCLWWIFGDLFRSKDLGGFAKTLWVLFIIVLPFIGLLAYLIVRGRGMNDRTLEAHREMQQRQEEYIKSVAGGSAGSSPTDQIASAKALLDSGAITQQEFDQIKARALASA